MSEQDGKRVGYDRSRWTISRTHEDAWLVVRIKSSSGWVVYPPMRSGLDVVVLRTDFPYIDEALDRGDIRPYAVWAKLRGYALATYTPLYTKRNHHG